MNFQKRIKSAWHGFINPSAESISHSADLLAAIERSGTALTGAAVNQETAMRVSAVSRCVRILSETVASLPLVIYRRLPNGGKERAPEHPLYKILHDKPNGWQTSMGFRETLMAHDVLRGNAYARKSMVRGRIDELLPIHPDRVEPRFENSRIVFKVYGGSGFGSAKDYEAKDIFYIPGLSFDGLVGRSAIADHRESVGLALAQEAYGASAYKSGGTKRIVLEHPGTLGEGAAERLRRAVEKAYGGIDNLGRMFVAEEGMKVSEVSMTVEDMQYLETRRFQVADISRIFGVPLHMLNETEKSTTWGSGIEQISLGFLAYTIRPWLIRWEQAINSQLLNDDEEYFAEHLTDALLRGDTKGRFAAYASALNNGWMNADEVRERENMNPLPDGKGKEYRFPLNTSTAQVGPEEVDQEERGQA